MTQTGRSTVTKLSAARRRAESDDRRVADAQSCDIEGADVVEATVLAHTVVSHHRGDDPWGRSSTFSKWAGRIAGLRWSVSVGGVRHIPMTGPVLIVCNERVGGFNPLLAAWALTQECGRVVRFTGVVDIAPLGPLTRKIGGLLSNPQEVSGALRAGEIVLVSASATRLGRHAGRVDAAHIGAAARLGAPIIPVAAISAPLSRSARVEVGEIVRPRKQRSGPLLGPELAEATRLQLQRLLDQTSQTGFSAVSA